jgi:hypothetical protein
MNTGTGGGVPFLSACFTFALQNRLISEPQPACLTTYDALVQPVMRLLATPLVDHCPVATAWGAAGRLGGRWARKKIQGWSSS